MLNDDYRRTPRVLCTSFGVEETKLVREQSFWPATHLHRLRPYLCPQVGPALIDPEDAAFAHTPINTF